MTVQVRPAQAEEQRTIRAIVRRAPLYPFGLRWQHFLVIAAATALPVKCDRVLLGAG